MLDDVAVARHERRLARQEAGKPATRDISSWRDTVEQIKSTDVACNDNAAASPTVSEQMEEFVTLMSTFMRHYSAGETCTRELKLLRALFASSPAARGAASSTVQGQSILSIFVNFIIKPSAAVDRVAVCKTVTVILASQSCELSESEQDLLCRLATGVGPSDQLRYAACEVVAAAMHNRASVQNKFDGSALDGFLSIAVSVPAIGEGSNRPARTSVSTWIGAINVLVSAISQPHNLHMQVACTTVIPVALGVLELAPASDPVVVAAVRFLYFVTVGNRKSIEALRMSRASAKLAAWITSFNVTTEKDWDLLGSVCTVAHTSCMTSVDAAVVIDSLLEKIGSIRPIDTSRSESLLMPLFQLFEEHVATRQQFAIRSLRALVCADLSSLTELLLLHKILKCLGFGHCKIQTPENTTHSAMCDRAAENLIPDTDKCDFSDGKLKRRDSVKNSDDKLLKAYGTQVTDKSHERSLCDHDDQPIKYLLDDMKSAGTPSMDTNDDASGHESADYDAFDLEIMKFTMANDARHPVAATLTSQSRHENIQMGDGTYARQRKSSIEFTPRRAKVHGIQAPSPKISGDAFDLPCSPRSSAGKKRRRKRNPFSQKEIEELLALYKKHHARWDRWSFIHKIGNFHSNRTPSDLKDKFRNLSKNNLEKFNIKCSAPASPTSIET